MTVRVLIVDDQEPFRLAARTVVEITEGFEVAGEAETGEAAVEAARELRPDLILMDVNLPGIDGMEATRRILEDSGDRVVVLMLSTYEADEYAPRAAEVGAAAYIPKSEFEPDRLADAWSAAGGKGANVIEQTTDAERLRGVPFFEDLTPEDLDRVARIGEHRRFDADETIIAKDTAGQALFVIVSGRATVDAGGKTHELGPGDFVGEMALLGGRPRSATVTAAEPTECLVFEAMYFKPFLIKNPSVAVAILEGVVERLREVQERID